MGVDFINLSFFTWIVEALIIVREILDEDKDWVYLLFILVLFLKCLVL